MTRTRRLIIGGVDTHASTHHAAVIDLKGRLLDDAEFAASPAGYAQLLIWLRERGQLPSVGIEGTGAYGAGLARHLHEKGVTVLEVPVQNGDCAASTARATHSMPRPPPAPCWPATPAAHPSSPPGESRRSACCASPEPVQ